MTAPLYPLNDDAFSSWWDELVSILINEHSGAEAVMRYLSSEYWRGYYEDGYTPYAAFIEEECVDG